MSDTSQEPQPEQGRPRRRDAAATRQLLLDAAMRRFATDGYDTTATRQIANDAGVNVALIARYFGSKEGLFEHCVREAAAVVGRAASTVDEGEGSEGQIPRIADAISRLSAGVGSGAATHALLLLLRSSGDPHAERMRVSVLSGFAERLAEVGDAADPEARLLRAQVLLATSVGISILRSADGLEPLGSATREQLVDPVGEVAAALLSSAR
ncbi:TetR/AcrR family transcriptional regulator [Demequina sp. NBRC 110054]|uniref:TetR/AcrR family transcriptional regulator n=1 Tax=Demequina sp. NBRC 110054 TaxID=1570343 RepID=UPI0009FE76EC|nr:TetR/AcrR family transcriptional regulator [Demequina sp. NBRC 110054]